MATRFQRDAQLCVAAAGAASPLWECFALVGRAAAERYSLGRTRLAFQPPRVILNRKTFGDMNMADVQDIKQAAHRLIDQLPEQASWDDLMYKIYVQQSIDRGLADVDAGRTISHDEVAALFAKPR